MHPALLVSVCVAGSALSSWAVSSVAQPAAASVEPVAPTLDAGLLEKLREELDDLRRTTELTSSAPVEGAARRVPASQELALADVEEAVRRLVATDALVAPEELGPDLWPGGAASAHAALRAILDLDVDGEEARELWAEAAENGQLHELLAAMEETMASVPESADKHFDRARAYYSAARAHPNNVDGNWWVESNDAYTKALEYDPEHWDARYNKARNMSFWPAAYGGQAGAIRHFETLVDQQEARTSRPEYGGTYLWLGNLYDQQGRTELARETWERGLRLFPGNEALQSRLDSL